MKANDYKSNDKSEKNNYLVISIEVIDISKSYQVKFRGGPPELIGHLSIPKTLSTRHVLLDMMHCEI